jgi:hypothetical protein
VALGQIAQDAPEQLPRLLPARGIRARKQLGREHPPALRPRREQRLIRQLALMVDRRARLATPVDLDLRGIEIQRHRIIDAPPELAIDRVRAPGERRFGRP